MVTVTFRFIDKVSLSVSSEISCVYLANVTIYHLRMTAHLVISVLTQDRCEVKTNSHE